MNERHKEFFQAPPHLYERDISPDHTNRLYVRGIHALSVWLREAYSFRRDPMEIFHAARTANESLLRHAVDGLEFVGLMDLADRYSNSLRVEMLWDNNDREKPSEFGVFLQRAFNNPLLSDHNHEHSRRFERWVEAFLLNVGALRHEDSVADWINAVFLTAYFHDMDQLVSLERNIEEHRGKGKALPELKVKKGHALAGAVMMLALHKRYSGVTLMRTRDAWETCAGAAYMMLKHDEPEAFGDALKGRGLPYWVDREGICRLYHGEELQERFDRNELDLAKLTPSQLVELLRMQKGEHDFLDDDSWFGLHPLFEREYAHELAELAVNDRPLLAYVKENQRKSLDLMAEVSVRADLLEMVSPPMEAIFRTLNTQYSQHRPLYRHEEDISKRMDDLKHGQGNIEPDMDSDTRRILWEFFHIDTISGATSIGTSRYVNRVHRENALMGVLAFRDIGARLMQGDVSVIREHYDIRIREVGKKVLRKAGISSLRSHFLTRGTSQDTNHAVGRELMKSGKTEFYDQYMRKMESLEREAQHTVESVQKGSGEFPFYREEDIRQFVHLCDMAFEELGREYGISKKKLRHYRRNATRGNFGSTTPYRSYDSVASPKHIRTFLASSNKGEQ